MEYHALPLVAVTIVKLGRYFLLKIVKYGGVKAAIFGAPIEHTIGEVEAHGFRFMKIIDSLGGPGSKPGPPPYPGYSRADSGAKKPFGLTKLTSNKTHLREWLGRYYEGSEVFERRSKEMLVLSLVLSLS